MAFVRCYSGDDGQSHFEDLDLLPPGVGEWKGLAAASIVFTRRPDGRFEDWHNAPRRQYVIFLSGGQMEVVIGDGTSRRFGPGDGCTFRRPYRPGAYKQECRGRSTGGYRTFSGLM